MTAVRLATIGDLIDTGHGLNAWCPACRRHADGIDLARLAARYGRAATFVKPASPIRIACAGCGATPMRYQLAVPERG